jgi:hypothetical protein
LFSVRSIDNEDSELGGPAHSRLRRGSRRATKRSSSIVALAVACALTPILAGCGGSSSSSKPAVCQDLSSFESAVKDLTNLNVSQNGLSSVKPALQKVEQTGTKLVDSAKKQFGSAAQDLERALKNLGSTIQSLGQASSVSAAASSVSNAAQQVSNASQSLANDLHNTCK